jgi:amino acid transporter
METRTDNNKDTENSSSGGQPVPTFSVLSTLAVMVGIVLGIGIFRLPPIVAANAATGTEFILFWVAGGAISLLGALCYAELATTWPDAGGEYQFLQKGFGPSVAFLFSWGRLAVIQTGSIALIAFILGDYASLVLNLGTYSSAFYAAVTVIILTGLNMMGTRYSRSAQNIVTTLVVLSLLVLIATGLLADTAVPLPDSSAASETAWGAAMIFVLLTYGGWNETVYLSAEIKDVRKNMALVLAVGIGIITLIYTLVNYAYLSVLGLEGLQNSETVGAAFTEIVFGQNGGLIVAVIVIVASLSTANATIITGARTNYAMGRDFHALRYLGRWDGVNNTPANALLVQGLIALLLVFLGAFTEEAVSTMVDYTAPVFWFFLLLSVTTLFIFRNNGDGKDSSYRVPLYPFTPILFVIVCCYMLYSSLAFTGFGAFVGIGILLLGIPILLWNNSYK